MSMNEYDEYTYGMGNYNKAMGPGAYGNQFTSCACNMMGTYEMPYYSNAMPGYDGIPHGNTCNCGRGI